MSFMRLVGPGVVVLALVACGDEATQSTPPPGTAGSGGSGAGGADGGGGTGPGGGGEGGAPACGETLALDDLEGGAYDTRFTIAGVASRFGIAPFVHDFAADTDGTIIAAGRFDTHAGASVAPLLRYENGAWEEARTSWEIAPPDDGFSAVAISPSGVLALATNDSFGPREGEIWLDDGSGLVSIAEFEGQVRSLAFFDDALWVAGWFSSKSNPTLTNLAVYDGVGWGPPPGGAVDGPVYELLVAAGSLYIGGAFTTVGGTAAASVAAYDGNGYTAYDLPGALGVYALARTDAGELYLGGAFGDFIAPSGLAHWNGASWEIVGGGLAQYQTRAVVADIVAHGETIDVTGCFNSAGGLDGDTGAVPAHSFARWNGGWQTLDEIGGGSSPWFVPFVCGDEGPGAIWDAPHQRLAHDGQRLIAGGAFPGAGFVQSQSLVAHDGTSWVPEGSAGLGIGGSLERIAEGNCEVYALGAFTHVAGEAAHGRVAHYEGDTWKVLADPLPSDAWCPALDVDDTGQVAVGCMVFPPAGDAEGVILRREGDAMVPLAAPGPVMAVAYSPSGTLFLAGTPGYLARLDDDGFTLIEEGFDAPAQFLDVRADDDVLAAGYFTLVGGIAASRIAHYDGSAWSALGEGIPGPVTALARDATTVYVSSYDEGNGAYLLGAFDGTTWTELAGGGSGLEVVPEFNFNAIVAIEGGLLAGGTAEVEGGRGVLVYRDGVFEALDGGVSAISVGGLAVTPDAVWIAGGITAAGSDGQSSVGVARYVAP